MNYCERVGFSEQTLCKSGEEVVMTRKTFVTLVSIAALGLGSTAVAAQGRGGGGGVLHGGGGGFGGFGRGGGFGGAGVAAVPRGGAGPMMMQGGRGGPMATAPMAGGRVMGWGGNRFHNRNFFAFGFGAPIYDYAYDPCWSWDGWQWAYVCGDYGY
jgi:hypothetical protein